MPLNILLPLVIFGIALLALLIHVMGFSRRFDLRDAAMARKRWLREFPDDRVDSVEIAPDHHAALVETDQGLGLVWSFGGDTVARRISGADLTPCRAGLRLDLHEFAAPGVTIALPEAAATQWRARIDAAAPRDTAI